MVLEPKKAQQSSKDTGAHTTWQAPKDGLQIKGFVGGHIPHWLDTKKIN